MTQNKDVGGKIDNIQLWRKGEEIKESKANQVRHFLRREFSGTRPPSQILPQSRNIGQVQQFKVIEVKTDYVECNEWDGTDKGAVVKLALPPLIRRSPFDPTKGGKGRGLFTYAYASDIARESTNNADSSTENQVITPAYEVDDIIYGISNVIGGTSTVARPDGEDPEVLEFMDINIDGRTFANEA